MKFSEEIFTDFDFLSDEQKTAFIRALIHLAKSDGNFDDEEMEYITVLADMHGIAHSEIVRFKEEDTEDAVLESLQVMDNRRIALELIKELCLLAHTDDQLSDEEMVFIGKCGLAMNIELEKIEQISNWVIDRIVWLEQAKIIFED